MLWILAALIEPVFDAFVNIIDSNILHRFPVDAIVLFFYVTIIKLFFLPFLFMFGMPHLPSLSHLSLFFVFGLIDVVGLSMYLMALREDDTSVVASLFSLSKVLIPILAFFIVGELLDVHQYIGFAIVILSSALLTLDRNHLGFKLNKSFFLMGGGAILFSIQAVLFKYILGSVDWITTFFWTFIFTAVLVLLMATGSSYRKRISKSVEIIKQPLLTVRAFLGMASTVAVVFVISIVPVTVARSVSATQSLFVLIYAGLLSRHLPGFFKEKLDARSVGRKIPLFILVITGVILTVA